MFCNLDTDRLQQVHHTVQHQTQSAPSLKKLAQVHRFCDKYKKLLDSVGLIAEVEEIANQFPTASQTERKFLAQRLNKYDQVWVQLALAAAKRAAPTYGGGLPWSPTLARAGSQARYWNQGLHRCRQTGDVHGDHIVLPLHYEPPCFTTASEIEEQYLAALDTWHKIKGSAANLRKQHLEDLIAQTMLRSDIPRKKALKQIMHREELCNLHRHQGSIMGHNRCDVIKSLIIPSPSSENPNATMEIHDPIQFQSIILRQNASKLGAAKNSVFNQDHLLDLLGDHGDTQTTDDLLAGTVDVTEVDTWDKIEDKEELKAFLCHMQRPRDTHRRPIPDMQ